MYVRFTHFSHLLTRSPQENKLKKEENLALLKKLSQDKFQTGILQSSRNLKRKHADFISDLRPPHQANSSNNVADVDTNDSLSSSDDYDLEPVPRHKPVAPILVTQNGNGNDNPSHSGSGLKEPLVLGADGLPIIQKRGRRNRPNEDINEVMVTREISSSPDWSTDADTSIIDDSGSDTDGLKETDSESAQDETSQSEIFDDGSEEESQSERDPDKALKSKPRVRESAFKTWASQKINESVGFTPSSHITQPMQPEKEKLNNQNVTANERLPLQSEATEDRSSARKAYYVPVSRSEHIQQQRSELPVVAEEQKIMEAIHNHPVVIISGDTGSGKTTQVPQFLLEAGYGDPKSPTPGMIGITQPRRVAAVSMARRVAAELGDMADKVSYKIRFDDKTSAKTAIKFMTDGILLREITQDFALSKYSVIVLDEAHERSVNTDMLMGMITRIIDLRKKLANDNHNVKPLQLVIMSATLHTSDIAQNTKLFRHGVPPLVSIEGRQFPVSIHWSRRTQRDYLEDMFRKICKGHRKLPPGAFLVFLNGENEIKALQRRLGESLPSTEPQGTGPKVQIAASEIPAEIEDFEVGSKVQWEEIGQAADELEFYGEDEEDGDSEFEVENEENTKAASKVHILPLYSQLRTADQMRVFEKPPDGSRLIVLATNVAETSLTIPGIRYVFDCGRSKQRRYDRQSGVQNFEIDWISKASAKQRSGRAGRTGPGHCYRLYSSAVYEQDFIENIQPEIVSTPIESVVLQLKSMGIDNVENFPFPTPPDHHSLRIAQRLLRNLGLISLQGNVTQLGREVSIYPLSPRLAKMIVIGSTDLCLPYVVAMVAAIAVPELFVPENQLDLTVPNRNNDSVYTAEDQRRDDLREERRKRYKHSQARLGGRAESADALKMLTAVCAYADGTNADRLCDEFSLRPKALKEALQLRQQLTSIIRANYPSRITSFQADLPPLGKKTAQISTKLKQLITAGYLDQVAIHADTSPSPPEISSKPRRAIDVPYLPLIPLSMASSEVHEKAVFIHPSSILARMSPSELPQYLVYSHLQKAAPSVVGGDNIPKTRMFPLTPTSGNILAALADGTPLLDYGKPIGKVESLGGVPERRQCWVVPSLVGSAGSLGWPLPAKKVLQRKDPKEGWVVEKFLTGR